ncbi:MAG: hypothetical protein LBK77_06225 [Spirochaetaceae bacterium]|nr:hypothetical protein [Spirochaetaceae bacterium]
MKWSNVFPVLSALCCLSCGMEDYVYLEPVTSAYSTAVSSAVITTPSNSSTYFRYYTIFYRIYISDLDLSGISSDAERRNINPALASHYNTLDPYTTSDNISPSAIGTVFNNLRYYPLYGSLDQSGEIPMYQILDNRSAETIRLDFTDTSAGPFMTTTYSPGSTFFLFRAGGFTQRPDRLFYHSSGSGNLSDDSIISSTVNTDVERKTNISASQRYTYVSMYIAAEGIDSNYTVIYSRPKHIGIFRLP